MILDWAADEPANRCPTYESEAIRCLTDITAVCGVLTEVL